MNLQDKFPKKTLFWKYMIVALKAMEQEYELYERLAKDRQFDMSRHLKKTMARFYQAAATGYQLDEKYILVVEESYFEPRDDYEKLALRIVKDLEDFFHIIYEKDCKKAGAFLERPMEVLEQFSSFGGNIDLEKAKAEEERYLSQLIEEAVAVDKSRKKAYIEEMESRECPPLIGDELLENRAPAKKEKPVKKTFPLIRRTSLRYDYDVIRCRGMAPDDPYRVKEGWEEVQAGWYLSALATLYEREMYENGYPYKSSKHEWPTSTNISGAMVKAYAAGAGELLPRLRCYSYDRSFEGVYDLLCGKDVREQFPDKNEKGYVNMGIHAIQDGDGRAFTQALLKRVRYVRGWYELYSIAHDEWGCSLVRLAEESGLEYEKVAAAELLDCEVRQLELSQIRLKNQEVLEQWLERAKQEHFKLDGIFPYFPQGQTVRRPYTSLDTVAYLVRSFTEEDEIYRLCKEFDHEGMYEYAEKLIKEGERLYTGYALRAYAHMQIHREQYDWEQVYMDLSQAIQYGTREEMPHVGNLAIMARRSRALICAGKDEKQYRKDMEHLEHDPYKGWYYRLVNQEESSGA